MQGPKVSTSVSCFECDFCKSESYFIEDGNSMDSGFEITCSHPDGKGCIGTSCWKTPDWCPLLPPNPKDEIEKLRKENTELWSELNRIVKNLGGITELCDDHFDSFLKWEN